MMGKRSREEVFDSSPGTLACGSAKALAVFRENPGALDVVITDQSMPEMTGIDLAREILRIRPGLPVILGTGFSETVDAETARAAGLTRFMIKPFSMREMASAIRQALGEKG